jgi:hypothetical protein
MVIQKNARIIIILLVLVLFCPSLYANDEFKQWLQQEKSSFQEYKDKRDKEFTAFLKTQWKGVELLKGFKRDTAPKPVVMPMARPVAKPDVTDKPEPVSPSMVKKLPLPVLPVTQAELPPEPAVPPKGIKITVDYFGNSLIFYYDQKLKAPIFGAISEKSVSAFWSTLSLADYDALIEQINTKAKALKLSDWSYALLVNSISKQIYPAVKNNQSLLTWFIMAKAGYKARIAYDSQNVYLLIPSHQQLYSVPYFTLEKTRYYAVSFDGKENRLGQVYTYDGNYPGADKALDMRLVDEVITKRRLEQRDLSFEFEGKKYAIKIAYDGQRVNYMSTYPQLDLEWYFKARVDVATATSLQNQLQEYIRGMDEQRAVNYLLRFVQTSLKYKTDERQFGKENYLFLEETLSHPYSDCEDRSILFAWLVQTLLGLDVIGLDFPGHVATAVKFNSRVEGDAVTYKGARYVISDPTYINASAGMTMPTYKNSKPGIIVVR